MKIDTITGRFLMEDLIGHRFDRLLVKGKYGRDGQNRMKWDCYCDCGNTVQRRGDYLKSGKNQSCGCLAREISSALRKMSVTHGLSRTPCGCSWFSMMDRCFNTRSKDYKRYGASGRTVCEFIRSTPLNLLLLIGERPPLKSIDRINNNGSYTCGQCSECLSKGWPMNVRWATAREQANNK